MLINITEEERDSILAGLRLLQEYQLGAYQRSDIDAIVTNSEKHDGLDLGEIDELAENINCSPVEPPNPTIWVDVDGGCVQSVYGDKMPEGMSLDVRLRDWDNIKEGDPDPIEDENYQPAACYL